MQYRSKNAFSGGVQLAILLSFTYFGLMILSLFATSMEHSDNLTLVWIFRGATLVFFFLIPAVMYTGITQGWEPARLGLYRHVGPLQLLLGLLLISIAGIIAISFEGISRKAISYFPSIDHLALKLESTYDEGVRMGLKGSLPDLILGIFILAILPALAEEIYFRGALQQLLNRWWKSPAVAILVSSVLFSLMHFSVYLFLSRFVLGLTLGLLFYQTRNLWVSIAAHFFNNAMAVINMLFFSEGKKETESADLPEFYQWLFILPAIALWVFLIKRLYRISERNRNKIIQEEATLTDKL